jgi:hypothetical protein
MAARRNSTWVSGPPATAAPKPTPSRLRGHRGRSALTEETIAELASILAAAYERYRRIVRVDEDAENVPEKELDTGARSSPHGQ